MPGDVPTAFTVDEFNAAFALIMPPDEARERAQWYSRPLPREDELGPWLPEHLEIEDPRGYSPDLLDLLSLTSDSTAAKVWRAMALSPAEGRARQAALRARLEAARTADASTKRQ